MAETEAVVVRLSADLGRRGESALRLWEGWPGERDRGVKRAEEGGDKTLRAERRGEDQDW
jgi:hypothetical protein